MVVLGTGLGIDLATRNELYANIKWAGIDRMYLSGSFKTAHSLAPKWDIHSEVFASGILDSHQGQKAANHEQRNS